MSSSVVDLGSQFSGPRAYFSVEGKIFAWSNALSWGHNYNYDTYQPLNNLEVKEHVITSYQASVQCSGIYLTSENLTTVGVQALMGANGGDHLNNLLTMGELTITIEDTTTGKLLVQCQGCKLQSSNINVSNPAMSSQDMSFVVRRIVEFGN